MTNSEARDSSIPADIDRSALDADGRVCVDAPCLNCGYNLRTLAADGVCPECAHAVAPSLRGDLLRFASPSWVRKLASGTLLILIAVGMSVGLCFLIPVVTGIVFSIRGTGPGGAPPTTLFALIKLVEIVLAAGVLALVMLGLLRLSSRDPATQHRPQGFSVRRFVRFGLWLMPVPAYVGYVLTPPTMYGPLGFAGAAPSAVIVLSSLVAYVLVPLAALRHVGALMRRIPRAGLVRFVQIEFWGLVVSSSILVPSSTWMSFAFFIPLFRAVSAVGPVPATPTSAPVLVSQTQPARNVTVTNVTMSRTITATSPPGLGGAATMPTTAPALPAGVPRLGRGLMLAVTLTFLGGCSMLGFGIGAGVLLILVQRALAHAAREGEEIATLLTAGQPPAGQPPVPPGAGSTQTGV